MYAKYQRKEFVEARIPLSSYLTGMLYSKYIVACTYSAPFEIVKVTNTADRWVIVLAVNDKVCLIDCSIRINDCFIRVF